MVLPFTYLWNSNPPQITKTATALPAGVFNVVVTDSRGCSLSMNATVLNPTTVHATITGSSGLCPGGATNLCASSGMSAYSWSNGATTQCISATAVGAYTVTVTNSVGCTGTATVNVTQATLPNCFITGNDYICPASSTVLTAPAGYTYVWSTGSTRQFISVRTGNTYTVTVKNSSGCTSSCSKVVTSPMIYKATATNAKCSNGYKGKVTLAVSGGVPPYTFLWSNGATTQNISGLAAGTYSVGITDSKGCFAQTSARVLVTKAAADYTKIIGTFNANDIDTGRTIWFSASVKVNYAGQYPLTLQFTDQNIASSKFNINPAKATLIIDNSVTVATTVFTGTEWITTAPPNVTGNYFISGAIFAPRSKILKNLTNIAWKGIWSASSPVTSVEWKWAAAPYTQFSPLAGLNIKPVDDNTSSAINNFDPAGTPENYKPYVIAGARSTGGTDYVGVYTSIATTTPCADASFGIARTIDPDSDEPVTAIYNRVFPNPFSESTTIEFEATTYSDRSTVEVYSLSGAKIATLFEGETLENVRYSIDFNADKLPDGIYVYRIICGNEVVTGRIMLAR
ncbi:MAG: T9SS type A sorting domain-containing protein [Bacteroidetes bacterium]|nr:T9SS type A sorting domain-containing protein [Bacteroidota bacterium]